MTKPGQAGRFILLISILFVVAISASQYMEYRALHDMIYQHNRTQAKLYAERVNSYLLELITIKASGGSRLDEYVEQFSKGDEIKVRIIRSKSVTEQYGAHSHGYPRNRHEIDSLEDGIERFWEEEDGCFRVSPLIAVESCLGCHDAPGNSVEPVKPGYPLGLVEISVSNKNVKAAQEKLNVYKTLSAGLAFLFFIAYGYLIYSISSELETANARLAKALSDLDKSRDRLVRTEKLSALGILSGGVAHEILNPLNIIAANVQLIQMDDPPAEIKQSLDEIMDQVKRASGIVDSMNKLKDQSSGSGGLVNVNEILEEAAGNVANNKMAANITVERDMEDDIKEIVSDRAGLLQIFESVINNSVYALEEKGGGEIVLITRNEDNGVKIIIEDNGSGISEDAVSRVFDPFYTTRDPDKGKGLGLSIAHSIITGIGGDIAIESNPGKWTKVKIALPETHEENV